MVSQPPANGPHGTQGAFLPDVTGMSNADAAEAYAKAGIHIVPVLPGTKDPGSYIGLGWQHRATCDLDTVRQWWKRWPKAGIAMHPGPSGFLVIDVDHPTKVPADLWSYLNTVCRKTTNDPNNARGHYFFALKPGQRFGNGLGKLKPAKRGDGWGDVRCYGGAIILGPSVHPRAAEGGQYATAPGGNVAVLPDYIAERLNAAPEPDTYRTLTPAELDANATRFLSTYTDEKDPAALAAILKNFDSEPGARHGSMFDTLCWAMREGKAGCFEAQRAINELKGLWQIAIGGTMRNDDADEWNRMVRDAIFAADASGTVEQLWARAHRNQWPSPNTPLPVAERIAERSRGEGGPLAYWAEGWFVWEGPRWKPLTDNIFRGKLYKLFGNAFYINADGEHIPWNPDKAKLDRILDALKSLDGVLIDAHVTPGNWIDGRQETVIAYQNGLLRVSDRKLIDHTPEFFNTMALPFDYRAKVKAAGAKRWLKFVNEVLDNDKEAIAALQEWFGYVLSGRTDFHKMLMMIGRTRSGKGTIDKILTALVGAENHVGTNARDFCCASFSMTMMASLGLATIRM
jgi:hypothetical protein